MLAEACAGEALVDCADWNDWGMKAADNAEGIDTGIEGASLALSTEGTDTPAGKLGSRVSCRDGSDVEAEALGPDVTVVIGMLSGPNGAFEVSLRAALEAASVGCVEAAETEPFRFLATCSSSESSEGVRSITSAAEPPLIGPEAAARRRGRPTAASAALVVEEELLELYEAADAMRTAVAEAAALGRNGFDDGLSAIARPR